VDRRVVSAITAGVSESVEPAARTALTCRDTVLVVTPWRAPTSASVPATRPAAGLVMMAALALVSRRRVYLATNVVVALLSGFLAFHLVQISAPATDAVVLDSPLTGEWYVFERRQQLPAQRAHLGGEQRHRFPAPRREWLDAHGRR